MSSQLEIASMKGGVVILHDKEAQLKSKFEDILFALGLSVSEFDSISIGSDNIKSNHEHSVIIFDYGLYCLWYFERGKKSLSSKFESEDGALQYLAKTATYKAAYEFCLKSGQDVNDCSRSSPVYQMQAQMLESLNKKGFIA